jgi:hypothetical protein
MKSYRRPGPRGTTAAIRGSLCDEPLRSVCNAKPSSIPALKPAALEESLVAAFAAVRSAAGDIRWAFLVPHLSRELRKTEDQNATVFPE